MSEMAKSTIRLHGYVNPSTEPELAKAVQRLEETYSIASMVKEGVRCLARREGLLNSEEDVPASEEAAA